MSDQAADSKPTTTLPAEGLPIHSEDGVDLTLIRWMLSLTPRERLQVLQDMIDSITRLRNAQSEQ